MRIGTHLEDAYRYAYLCTIIKNHRIFMLRVLPFVVVVVLFVAFR
jgi:hypothetical protein